MLFAFFQLKVAIRRENPQASGVFGFAVPRAGPFRKLGGWSLR